MSLDEYFATAHEREQPIFEVVNAHLTNLGDVIVDPLSMGIKFKAGGTFVELRTMTKWVALCFSLRRKVTSNRMSRKVVEYGPKHYHVINLTDVSEIDDEILGWLTEAFEAQPGDKTEPSTTPNDNTT